MVCIPTLSMAVIRKSNVSILGSRSFKQKHLFFLAITRDVKLPNVGSSSDQPKGAPEDAPKHQEAEHPIRQATMNVRSVQSL